MVQQLFFRKKTIYYNITNLKNQNPYKLNLVFPKDLYTIMCKNNEKNDQFYRKVEFLMYTERVNFRPQSWKAASKLKPHRRLGTRLPSS